MRRPDSDFRSPCLLQREQALEGKGGKRPNGEVPEIVRQERVMGA